MLYRQLLYGGFQRLSNYCVIILDEIHEGSIFTHLLLALLKERSDFKLVLISASLETFPLELQIFLKTAPTPTVFIDLFFIISSNLINFFQLHLILYQKGRVFKTHSSFKKKCIILLDASYSRICCGY